MKQTNEIDSMKEKLTLLMTVLYSKNIVLIEKCNIQCFHLLCVERERNDIAVF